MPNYIWMGKAHARVVDGEAQTLEQGDEFEPTDAELNAFKDLMRRSDKQVPEGQTMGSGMLGTSPDSDIPQKGLLHRQELEEDGTLPLRRRGRPRRPDSDEEGVPETPRIAQPDIDANTPASSHEPFMGVEHDTSDSK